MTTTIGIDAAGKAGWVGVSIDDAGFTGALVGTLDAIIEWAEPVDAIGIDIPIGLTSNEARLSDRAARAFVGPRRASVFASPPALVLEHAGYAEINQALERAGKPKMSKQSWALVPRIIEVDSRKADPRIIEVHPEVSFTALAGEMLEWPKKTWNGQALRRHLLQSVGINLPEQLGDAGRVPVDDVLDAAVAAWSARRYATNNATSLPDSPIADPSGRPIAIWY